MRWDGVAVHIVEEELRLHQQIRPAGEPIHRVVTVRRRVRQQPIVLSRRDLLGGLLHEYERAT